ncbi:hypothetical protein ACF0H5_011126 [Mactra antiquata]
MEKKFLDLILYLGIICYVIPYVQSAGCEPGWIEYYDKCYFISDNRYNHNDLKHACSVRNASLWTWQNEEEWKWMSNIIEEGPRILYWTNLELINRRWTFTDGTVYNRNTAHWYQNKEPDRNSNSNKCAGMISYLPTKGQMQARRCTDGWGMICVRPKGMLDLCDMQDGWQYLDGRCLKLFDTPMSWQDARKTCQANQADFTLFKDYNELRSLDSLVTCRTKDNIAWIGLSDQVQPRTWRWINNDTLRYQRWVSYANHILVNGSTCAATSPMDGWAWRHYTCDTLLKFICNRTTGSCPPGWLQNQDRCYDPNVVTNSKKTWFDAKLYCNSIGASLLDINNDQEQQFIVSTLSSLKIDRSWLAFSDEKSSDVLQWLNGRPAVNSTDYQHWDTNFPKPVPKRFDCGLISRVLYQFKHGFYCTGNTDAMWSNAYCFNSNPFLCEMSVTTVPFSPTSAPVMNKCDKDWILHGSNCYYFGPVRNQSLKNWGDANDFCRSSGGNLVIISDPYEMSFITVQQSQILTAWIGLKYALGQQKWMWVDGTTPGQFWANETNFYPGEPDDYMNGQECVQIVGARQDYSGSWDDGNCSIAQGFICEKSSVPAVIFPPTGSPVPPIAVSPMCGFNWVYSTSDNYCYQIVLGVPRTWNGARSYCQQNGGDLMSISGPTEQNFIQGILSTGQYANLNLNFWIGATDQTNEGGWHWTDNTPFRYLNWHAGEPNNYVVGATPEDCAEMVPSWNYQWNDKYCSKEQVFICKKNAQTVSTTTLVPPTGINKATCTGVPMISGDYSVAGSGAFGASSARDTQHMALNSRILQGSSLGGWSAKTNDPNQYITVTFFNTIVVKGIVTAGRTDVDEWLTQYKLYYQETYYKEMLPYYDPPGTVKIFTANANATTPATNMLLFPFEAKTVKIVPVKWQNGISLRLEVLGCAEESCNPDYAVSGPLIADDSRLQASGTYDVAHDAKSARLRQVTPSVLPACWKPMTSDTNQWIRVDLGNVMVIRGVTIKGNPTAQEWVTQYKLKYSTTLDSGTLYYQEPYGRPKVIPGNVDNVSPSTYYFKSHFQARYVTIVPVAWNRSIALAFDVLVCQNGCLGKPLISGTMKVADTALNASSVLDNRHIPVRSRLNMPSNGAYGGAWIPRFSDTHQFIQVDLGFMVQITGVATQGAFDSQDWVKTYQLSYSSTGNQWVSYYELGSKPKVFTGNFENKQARKYYLLVPFIARYVRLWPLTWNNRIAVRWELYGCPGSDSGVKIGCYADNSLDPDLAFEPFTDPKVGMWPPMCIDHCFRKGFYYAGLQDAFKCYCGNSYGKYGPATDCNMKCMPQTNYICGGLHSNVIYTTGLTPQFNVCPPTWRSYLNRCYVLLTDVRGWYDARADCKTVGADLASPNSQAEQDFVYSLLKYNTQTASNSTSQGVWIGFNDVQDESLFNWADGRSVSYTNWGLNQPNHILNDDQDCVLMLNQGGGWKDSSCDAGHPYVCQMDKRPSQMPSPTRTPAGCRPGWDAYSAQCYLYVEALRSWSDSKAVCTSLGGRLLRINDKYEQAYVSSVLGTRKNRYWSDVNDLAIPGTYQHVGGIPDLGYTNWGQNRPDGTSQCVTLGSGRQAGLWYNEPCALLYGVVCEMPRANFPQPSVPPTTPSLTACGSGLIQTTILCYQVNRVAGHLTRKWLEAEDDCASKGGHLASFHSLNDINTVMKNGLVGPNTGFWIGLNDRATEKGYSWTDKTAANFFNWDYSEPNNANNQEDCVEMVSASGKWNDNACNSAKSWICAFLRGRAVVTKTPQTPPPAQSSSICNGLPPNNWLAYNGFCYYAVSGSGDQAKTWRQARLSCLQSGGDLASVSSMNEQLFIYKTVLKNTTTNAVWVGLNALDINAGYRWSDNSPVVYYNWNTNEPNDFGGEEDCVDLLIRTGKWNDEHCGTRRGYVCKARVGAKVTPPAPVALSGHCPSGFTELYNRCYRVYATAANWTTAQANCKNLGIGYNLASITDDLTNAFLTTMLADMKVSPWIGLHKNYQQTLLWANNDDTVYTNFAYNEPNGKQSEQCIAMSGMPPYAGQWRDYNCAIKKQYICMTKKDPTIATQEPVPSICDVRQNQHQFLTGCYFFVNQPMTWSAANQKCGKQGGYLTSINTIFEQAYVYVMMKRNHASGIWIGLNDVKQSGTYGWTDKWPVLYTNWAAGQPVGGQGCVMMNSTGRWVETNCNATSYPSICKVTTATPSLTPPAPNGACGLGWHQYNSKCYVIGVNAPRTALDATLYCQQLKASLVSIHDAATNKFLVSKMASLTNSQQSFWTSLHKSLNTGFQWIDRTPVQYTNWRPGEPSTRGWGGNLENCVEVFLSDGKWNDEDCNSKRLYICEKQQTVDGSMINPGTGGPPANIPTPFTRPSVLPIQIEPTLPTHRPVSPKLPPTPGNNHPVVTNPRTGPTLPVVSNKMSPNTGALPSISIPQYTGSVSVSPKGQVGNTVSTITGLGMSAGALAGVIIGSLLVILLVVLIVLYWRRNTTQGRLLKFGTEGANGFENRTYHYDSGKETVTETDNGLKLRSTSESSS